MNPMHQLTRRPVKAAFGALLLALAGVILALSGGQFWAAAWTRAGVEATYTTVAVVTGGDKPTGDSDPSLASASAAWEAARFLEQPEQQNWSIIRSRPRVGLVSGYSPGLNPLLDLYNFRSYDGGETMDSAPDAPYTYFILEVLAEEVQERQDPPQEGASYSESTWSISGQVLGVYGLQQGLRDPTGWQTDIRFTQYYSDGDAPIRHQLCRLRRERTVARPVSRRHCFWYEAPHFFRAEQILSGPVFLFDGTGRHLCDMAPEGAA